MCIPTLDVIYFITHWRKSCVPSNIIWKSMITMTLHIAVIVLIIFHKILHHDHTIQLCINIVNVLASSLPP